VNSTTRLLDVALALLPVLAFLAVLIFMDSFKLVHLRSVLQAILAGCVAALVASYGNPALLDALPLSALGFTRYVAPVTEELLKSLYVVSLVRRRRVGFPVDAAILGFAVGAGFALVENVDYLLRMEAARPVLWIVRGFGTAVGHGSSTSILAMISQGLSGRHPRSRVFVFAPGLLAAVALHSFFNHFILQPLLATALLLVVLPLLMVGVFERSRASTRAWLREGFHGDVEFLTTILSGEVAQTRVGAYLQSLKSRFAGTVVADMLCLIRINLELSLRGKAILIAREAGLEMPVGDDVRANLEELRYLEKAIGATGLLAIRPMLKHTNRDLWHLYMLETAGGRGPLARGGP
jgi:RsiW-degrading membrane proteinase PrsW (M82 family)